MFSISKRPTRDLLKPKNDQLRMGTTRKNIGTQSCIFLEWKSENHSCQLEKREKSHKIGGGHQNQDLFKTSCRFVTWFVPLALHNMAVVSRRCWIPLTSQNRHEGNHLQKNPGMSSNLEQSIKVCLSERGLFCTSAC